MRLWDIEVGASLRVLEGHSFVRSVAWSPDGRRALWAAWNGVMRVWEDIDQQASIIEQQLQYTNAKVLLVGDSAAGKTSLSVRLAQNVWQPTTTSTVGAFATHLENSDRILH